VRHEPLGVLEAGVVVLAADATAATEATMLALASSLTALAETGQMSTIGGYTVTAVTVTPPIVAAVSAFCVGRKLRATS
jgi:hypothetical protein